MKAMFILFYLSFRLWDAETAGHSDLSRCSRYKWASFNVIQHNNNIIDRLLLWQHLQWRWGFSRGQVLRASERGRLNPLLDCSPGQTSQDSSTPWSTGGSTYCTSGNFDSVWDRWQFKSDVTSTSIIFVYSFLPWSDCMPLGHIPDTPTVQYAQVQARA